MRAAIALLLYLSTLSAVSADAFAQNRQGRREAGRLFRAGENHYDDERYEEALGSFERSFALFEHPATTYNVGLCLEKLGRLQEADAAFAQIVNNGRHRIARKARQARARIAGQVPTLRVSTGNGAGATITVDGQDCPSPCERRLDPGEHEIVVAAAYGEHRETVRLDPGQTFQLSLASIGNGHAAPAGATASTEEEAEAGESKVAPWLLWGGVALVAAGIGTMVYAGLSESDSRTIPILGLGITVGGIGIATTGVLLGGGEEYDDETESAPELSGER